MKVVGKEEERVVRMPGELAPSTQHSLGWNHL